MKIWKILFIPLFYIFSLVACKDPDPNPKTYQTYRHIHAVACSFCGYDTPNCAYSIITFLLPNGQLVDLYGPEGQSCGLYNQSIYWDINVSKGMFDKRDNTILEAQMVK
jgi:hypothetical protein